MRHILTAAAAIAVSGLLVSTAAVAQYQAGGPAQASGQCKVSTDGMGNDLRLYGSVPADCRCCSFGRWHRGPCAGSERRP